MKIRRDSAQRTTSSDFAVSPTQITRADTRTWRVVQSAHSISAQIRNNRPSAATTNRGKTEPWWRARSRILAGVRGSLTWLKVQFKMGGLRIIVDGCVPFNVPFSNGGSGIPPSLRSHALPRGIPEVRVVQDREHQVSGNRKQLSMISG